MAKDPPDDDPKLPAPLRYGGKVIHDRKELVSLTDMWRAAGSPAEKRPADWLSQVATREFVSHVEATLDAGQSGIQTSKGGRGIGGNTFGHWQIGLAYAKYLSHEFHMWANTAVRERMEEVQSGVRLPAPGSPSDPETILSVIEYLRAEAAQGRVATEALQRIEASEGSRCITDVAKLLNMQPIALRRELVGRRWIYQRPGSDVWIAYQDKLNSLLLEHAPHHYSGRDGTPRVKMNVLVTPKGMVRLAELLGRTLSQGESLR